MNQETTASAFQFLAPTPFPQRKLTDDQVAAIRARTHRRRRYWGEPLKVIAADFGVSTSLICMISKGIRRKP